MTKSGISLVLFFTLVINSNLGARGIPDSSFTMKLRGFVPKIYKQRETIYGIYSPHKNFSLPETGNQRILWTKRSKGGTILHTRSGENLLQSPYPNSSNSFTGDSYLLTLRDKKIVATAKMLKKSRFPLKAVSLFVYNHIADKTLGIALIPANTIFKNRRGDCTEHAVLTVALLRAMGIPARAVVGVVLTKDFRDRHNIFVYHMWVEAFHGGRWHIVDATRPFVVRANRYIAFSYHSLLSEIPLDYLRQMGAIYGVKISYIKGK